MKNISILSSRAFLILGFLVLGLALSAYIVVGMHNVAYGNSITGGDDASACNTNTVTSVVVGNQLSTNVVATTSRRAYVRIELPTDTMGVATNTVAISLNNGNAATAVTGRILSTSTPSMTLGLNTELPYTGTITALTSTGSTTVKVTNCIY